MSNGSQDREMILANFQAITGIEDISISLATLEQFNWDIDNAIVAAVSEDPAPNSTSQTQGPCEVNTTFNVEWRGREETFTLNVSETTIRTLKERLSSRVGVPKENFTIIGFPSLAVQTDDKSLQQMGVVHNSRLVMIETMNHSASRGHQSPAPGMYRFKISVEGADEELVFPASNTIAQVKSYVESSFSIPVPVQRWAGWPPGTSDSLELRDILLDVPLHRLNVTRRTNTVSSPTSDDEFLMEDELSETPGSSSSSGPSQRPLMTVGKTTEENVMQFLEVFEERLVRRQCLKGGVHVRGDWTLMGEGSTVRYGNVHPSFHFGSLKSAMTAAFSVPADSKRPLIIFLHSDKALSGHLFCSQVLCSESISHFIDEHFLIWAHDLTDKRLQQQILSECQSIFGVDGRRQVEFYIPEKLPLMIVITKIQSFPQVFAVFQGDISPDMLMAQLMDAVENYSQTRSIEKAAEVEQEQRSMLRAQQEQEYLDSLQRDREKDHLKKIEIKEKQLNNETEEAKMFSFIDLVPPEPDANVPSSDITFKLPSGERINRKFAHSNQLKLLSYYIGSKGFAPSQFKLIQNFPKRQYDEEEMDLTLEDLGLTRREILYVEERD